VILPIAKGFTVETAVDLPGEGLKKTVTRGERDDIHQVQALQLNPPFLRVVAAADRDKVDLRPFSIAGIRVEQVVVGGLPGKLQIRRITAYTAAGRQLSGQMAFFRLRRDRHGSGGRITDAETAPGRENRQKLGLELIFGKLFPGVAILEELGGQVEDLAALLKRRICSGFGSSGQALHGNVKCLLLGCSGQQAGSMADAGRLGRPVADPVDKPGPPYRANGVSRNDPETPALPVLI